MSRLETKNKYNNHQHKLKSRSHSFIENYRNRLRLMIQRTNLHLTRKLASALL
jgi:hypothetical protein